MPYASTSELPESIRRRLPEAAQRVYMAAFNSALESYKGDEAAAARVAWSAVNQQFQQVAGQWVGRKEARAMKIGEHGEGRLMREAISFANVHVDRTARMIHGISFMGARSSNGYGMKRTFLEQVVQRINDAAKAVKCYVNHHDPSIKGKWADTRDLAGVFQGARLEGDRVKCDLRCRVGPNGDMIMADAEANPDMVGLSAQHRSKTVTENGQEWCEQLHDIVRGDYVPDPATTGGMFESGSHDEPNDSQEADEMEWSDVTLEGLRVNRPDLYEAITTPLADQIKKLEEAKTTMGTELAAYKEHAAKDDAEKAADKMLLEAKVNEKAAKELRPLLVEAKDQAAREKIMGAFKTFQEGQGVRSQERTESKPGEPKGDFGRVLVA